MITIEETLMADSMIAAGFAPFLIYSEVMEGARRPLVFLEVVKEDFSLIGADGRTIEVPTATQLSASEDTETNVASGMSASDKTISTITITATNIIFCATEVTDAFQEEYPSLDIIRLNLRNMGSAVMEKIDANIRDVLAAGYGVYSSVTTLNYDALVDALATMKDNSWIADPTNPPFLLISPMQEKVFLKDTKFVETPRFYSGDASLLHGEAGVLAGCRVLVTPALKKVGAQSYALIVFPPNYKYGPSIVFAWKRRLRAKTERYESKEVQYTVVTARGKSGVVQSLGVQRIDITSTP